MNDLITYLAPALDNATYVDLFTWTLLLIPILFVVPTFVFFIIKQAFTLAKQFTS